MEPWPCSAFFLGSIREGSRRACWGMMALCWAGLCATDSQPRMAAAAATRGAARLQPRLISLAILMSILTAAHAFSECGDYYYISPGMSGVLQSPDYPSMYPTYSRCIWLIETSGQDYRVQLTFTYTGERYNGTCSDYLEVRDGGQYAPVLGQYCDNHTNEVVISGYIWMWVYFKSDGITGSSSVLTATFTTYTNTTAAANTTKPFSDCRSFEFECRNKMCASLSYRCDGYNDCGCKNNCDEDECYTLSITRGVQISISVGVGVCTFLVVCVLSFLIEGQHSWSSSLAEAKLEKQTQEEARRRRVSRAFSKFIGTTSDNNLSNIHGNTSFNAIKTPAPRTSGLKGPLATLTVPPPNAPAFKVPDMTVTDIDA